MKELAHGGVVECEPVLVGSTEFVPAELNLFYWRINPAIKTVIVKDGGSSDRKKEKREKGRTG